jgi:hypothetical protein
MNDFEKSYAIVKKAIEEDWWSKRIESIRAQKDKLLKKMGFFPKRSTNNFDIRFKTHNSGRV